MRKFDVWNFTVIDSDKRGVIDSIESEIELFIDDSLKVYDENGIYIADAVYSPENGIAQEILKMRGVL